MGVKPIQFGGSFIIKREGDRGAAIRAAQHATNSPIDPDNKDQFETIDRSLKPGEYRAFGLYVEPEKYKDPRAAKGYYVLHVDDKFDPTLIGNLNELEILFERVKQSILRPVLQLVKPKPRQVAAVAASKIKTA